MPFRPCLLGLLRRFVVDSRGVSAVEAGLLFPLLVTLLCGSMDTGVALLVNQKMITSTQTVADILAREDDITDFEIEDAVAAGRLSLMPYPVASYGVDIVGIQFIGVTATPTVIWRDTFDMQPNNDILARAAGLGLQNEGVIAVTVAYRHTPYFSGVLTGDFNMQEVSYVRGRRGLFVTRTRE